MCIVAKTDVDVAGLPLGVASAVTAVIDQLKSMQSLSLNCDDVSPAMRRWKRVRLAVKLFGLPFFSDAARRKSVFLGESNLAVHEGMMVQCACH